MIADNSWFSMKLNLKNYKNPFLSLHAPLVVLTMLVFAFIIWSAVFFIQLPYDGITWEPRSGLITDVQGPALQAGLQAGEEIVSLNGTAWDTPFFSYQTAVGVPVRFTVRQGNTERTVAVTPVTPSIAILVSRLLLIFISLGFWFIGLVLWIFDPLHRVTRLFFLACLLTASLLVAGALSTTLLPWAVMLFFILQIILPPTVLRLFLLFPGPFSPRLRRIVSIPVSAIAILLVVLTLIATFTTHQQDALWLWRARRIFASTTLILAILFLVSNWQSAGLHKKQQKRLVIAGMVASVLPMLLLSFLPELLSDRPLVDYQWTLPFLLLMPLSFSYAVRQGQLGRIDFVLNRSLVYLLLSAGLTAVYVLVFLALTETRVNILQYPLVSASLAALIALLVAPLAARLQRWMDRKFYGGWYDYRTIIFETNQELGRTLDLNHLTAQLMANARIMRFKQAALLWPDSEQIVMQDSYGFDPNVWSRYSLQKGGVLAEYLKEIGAPVGQTVLFDALAGSLQWETLAQNEQNLLAEKMIALWVPLVSHDTLRGVLLLGERQASEALDAQDLDILLTVSNQAALAAENVVLLQRLQARLVEIAQNRDELSEAQFRLLQSREDERLRLAREMHDGPVQDLQGALLQLGTLASSTGDLNNIPQVKTLRVELLKVVGELRTICRDLRPPALAPFGLEAAIRSYVGTLQDKYPKLDFQVNLMHDGQLLPIVTRLALFRICQEALNNIAQHAQAHHSLVRLDITDDSVILEISDDGQGFEAPEHMSQLALTGHLGLLGITERVEVIGGTLNIHTRPGQGTTLRVQVAKPDGPSETAQN